MAVVSFASAHTASIVIVSVCVFVAVVVADPLSLPRPLFVNFPLLATLYICILAHCLLSSAGISA